MVYSRGRVQVLSQLTQVLAVNGRVLEKCSIGSPSSTTKGTLRSASSSLGARLLSRGLLASLVLWRLLQRSLGDLGPLYLLVFAVSRLLLGEWGLLNVLGHLLCSRLGRLLDLLSGRGLSLGDHVFVDV